MNTIYELDVAVVKLLICDVVGSAVVVGAKIDDYNVRRWMGREVPFFGIIAPDFDCSPRGI